MSKGTASDKMAAFIVTIQDSPVYNLTPLRNLVNSVKVSKKNECLSVMGWLWTCLFTVVGSLIFNQLFSNKYIILLKGMTKHTRCSLPYIAVVKASCQNNRNYYWLFIRFIHFQFYLQSCAPIVDLSFKPGVFPKIAKSQEIIFWTVDCVD